MSYATDGKCHNAQAGTFGHECGKPAAWIGTKASGFRSGFCHGCKVYGDERHGYVSWEAVKPRLDDRDQSILAARLKHWDKRPGPRVGDFVKMRDGTLRRFTHDWGNGLQTTCKAFPGNASFYFGDYGYVEFSGSLDPSIPKTELRELSEGMQGAFWFFHHDHRRAHNGVYFDAPCRLFEQT